jgi:hypothetical protein
MAMIAVSSANVATTFCSSVGKSLVYRRYRIGPKIKVSYIPEVGHVGRNM